MEPLYKLTLLDSTPKRPKPSEEFKKVNQGPILMT